MKRIAEPDYQHGLTEAIDHVNLSLGGDVALPLVLLQNSCYRATTLLADVREVTQLHAIKVLDHSAPV